jgi:hypothetical protein
MIMEEFKIKEQSRRASNNNLEETLKCKIYDNMRLFNRGGIENQKNPVGKLESMKLFSNTLVRNQNSLTNLHNSGQV